MFKQPLYDYKKIGVIYEFANGRVIKAIYNSEIVAIKMYSKNFDISKNEYTRELKYLTKLKHPNIIKILYNYEDQYFYYIVLEYMEFTLRSYFDFIGKKLESKLVKSFMSQLLQGVEYIHGYRIIHADLKSTNILVNRQGDLKIIDFGFSIDYTGEKLSSLLPENDEERNILGTLWFRSPELLLGETIVDYSMDIWSIGCIFAEMITRIPLFTGDSEIDQIFRIFKRLGTPTKEVWSNIDIMPFMKESYPKWNVRSTEETFRDISSNKDIRNLLSKLLIYEPSKRISAAKALQELNKLSI